MQVLVLSCGRTGTNMLLEIMRGNSRLDATPFAEDKYLFQDSRALPDGYLSKCDTVYINNLEQIDELFKNNPLLRILFTVRDWRDCAMSLPFERENMISFTERYRNDFKSDRYKDIDKSQVKLYKRIDTVYEGFFKEDKNKKDINEVFDKIEPLLLKYGYESDYTI